MRRTERIFKKTEMLVMALVMAGCISSCTDDETGRMPEGPSKAMTLDVNAEKLDSRALVDGNTMPVGSGLGLFVYGADGALYEGTEGNVSAVLGNGGAWDISPAVSLYMDKATVYAYHPYKSGVQDPANVAVDVTDGQDYMWATPFEGACFDNYEVSLTMNHALAGIRMKIVKGTYTGTGAVSSVTMQGDNAATTATMDATDGSLDDIGGIGTVIEKTYTGTDGNIGTSGMTVDFPVVPVDGVSSTIEFMVTVDGIVYTATTAATELLAGYKYEYTLTLNGEEAELSRVVVDGWTGSSAGPATIDVGYKVTLAGNLEGIAIHTSVTDGNVTITAVPVNEGQTVLDVDTTGNATVTQTSQSNGSLIIELTNIVGDETVTFYGVEDN